MAGVWLGIDPGKACGFAAWDGDSHQFLELNTKTVVGTLLSIHHYSVFQRFREVIIENPAANKSLFARHDGREAVARQKIAQNVGSNKRDGEIIIEWCQYHGIAYSLYTPKSNAPKWTAAYFGTVTGILRSNEHERDAGRLVYGR